MIIYNVTIKVDHDIHDEWLSWMKSKHIPDVIATKLLHDGQICKLLGQDERDGITYAVQYNCESMKVYKTYEKTHAPALQKEHTTKYQGHFVAFRTLLEVV